MTDMTTQQTGSASDQPEALVLAKLRRLHEEKTYFQESYAQELRTSNELRRLNAELLEALKDTTEALADVQNKLGIKVNTPTLDKSLVVIAKVEERA